MNEEVDKSFSLSQPLTWPLLCFVFLMTERAARYHNSCTIDDELNMTIYSCNHPGCSAGKAVRGVRQGHKKKGKIPSVFLRLTSWDARPMRHRGG